MVGDISIAENIYIACGKTDMRKSIDGLAAMVQSQYHLDPFSKSIFLFCGGTLAKEMVQFICIGTLIFSPLEQHQFAFEHR